MNPLQSQINIPSILKIGDGEIKNIGQYLQDVGLKNVVCFFSLGIEELVGDKIYNSFEKHNIIVLNKEDIENIDIENIMHTAFSIPKSTDALIGIGGGKALDYSKYCAHVLSLPFISVPTSTSNDGFCSPGASLMVQGKRKSVKATIPYGVVVDLAIIKSSPDYCIFSGIGDLISKVSACYDWKEASEKGLETFNDFAYLISQNSVTELLHYQQDDIRSRRFLYHLVNSLLMSGISMEITGSSRPASGSEHLISHSLDEITEMPNMHGIQVGLATYLCTALQNNNNDLVKDFLMNTGFWGYLFEHPLNKLEFINAVKKAPSLKEDFYTVLSNSENIKNAIYFIENDDIMKRALK